MTSNNADALIALGANIPSPAGTPAQTLKAALAVLAGAGIEIAGVSPFYETEAWPNPDDPPFMNAVAALRTRLQPFALMALLHEVETDFGRTRSVSNAARALDLDILDYAGKVSDGPVVLPHPRLAERRFVLEPLKHVAPHWRHPVSGRDINALLKALP
jgi:2-amino-4-hydroxy-6-hydroxymethyldihydropteridine diphosphokinase